MKCLMEILNNGYYGIYPKTVSTMINEPIEVRVARLYAEIAATNANVAGMVAQNAVHAARGEYPSFDFDDFHEQATLIRDISEQLIGKP